MSIKITLERETNDGLKEQTVELDTDKDFGIDEDNIDGELCRMGNIMCLYGDLYSDARAQYARDEMTIDRYEKFYDLWFRDRKNYPLEKGEKEPTVDKYRSLVANVPAVVEAKAKLVRTKRNLYKIENMYRSLYKKSECLVALAYKHKREIQSTLG